MNTKDSWTENVSSSFFLPLPGGGSGEQFGAHAHGWPADGMRPATRLLFWYCSGFCWTTGTSWIAVPTTSGSTATAIGLPDGPTVVADAERTERHLRPEVVANSS